MELIDNCRRLNALYKTRDMWSWMAEQTRKRGEVVGKYEYLTNMGINSNRHPLSHCYLCDYANKTNYKESICENCPLSKYKTLSTVYGIEMPCTEHDPTLSTYYFTDATIEDRVNAAISIVKMCDADIASILSRHKVLRFLTIIVRG